MPVTTDSETEEMGVYALSITPDTELASNTVLAENFKLKSQSGKLAEVAEAYYYPDASEIKLTAIAPLSKANEAFTLTSSGLKSTDGTAADVNLSVLLYNENSIEFNTLAVQAISFSPISDISGKTGITTNVRIANAKGEPASGIVCIYDGETLCGEAEFYVKADGFTKVAVNTKEHTFTNRLNVTAIIV